MGLVQLPTAANNQVKLRYTLTSSGTLTIPGVSSANPITATVVCLGGGAGGMCGINVNWVSNNYWGATTYGVAAGGGYGGNGGNVAIGQMVIAGSVTYIVGAGGTGATAGTNNNNLPGGSAGGYTLFGHIFAPGGRGIFTSGGGEASAGVIPNSGLGALNLYRFTGNIENDTNSVTIRPEMPFSNGSFNMDGSFTALNYYNSASGQYKSTGAKTFMGSHGGGLMPSGGNSASGQTTNAGQNGVDGGSGGAGSGAISASTGSTGANGGGISASTSYAALQGYSQFAGGGGGSGGTGRSDGGAARAGGNGGAATLFGGAGGNGGTGGSASGGATAAGGAGSNGSGYGAGGGGGGGSASGNTAGVGTGSGTGPAGGNGGNGSQGVIYIFW